MSYGDTDINELVFQTALVEPSDLLILGSTFEKLEKTERTDLDGKLKSIRIFNGSIRKVPGKLS